MLTLASQWHCSSAVRSFCAHGANLLVVADLNAFLGEITSWNVHRRWREVAIDHLVDPAFLPCFMVDFAIEAKKVESNQI